MLEAIRWAVDEAKTLVAVDLEGRQFSVLGYGTMRDGSQYVTVRPFEGGDDSIFTLSAAQLMNDWRLS